MEKGHKDSKSGKSVSPKGDSSGYLATDVSKIKSNKWWCADYSCSFGGTIYSSGDVQRICFVTPPATGCPTPTTLNDGSSWAKTGGERLDG